MKKFNNSIIQHRGDPSRRILCMDCRVPVCQRKGCQTCRNCRRIDCHTSHCKEKPQSTGDTKIRVPKDAEEKAAWRCDNCLLRCAVCQEFLVRESLTLDQWKKVSCRRVWCEQCASPPCKVEGCRTCDSCHDPACRAQRCTKSKYRLPEKSIPTKAEQQFFRCLNCFLCAACGTKCSNNVHAQLKRSKSTGSWFCQACAKKLRESRALGGQKGRDSKPGA